MADSWRTEIQRHRVLVTIDEGCGLQKIASLHFQGDEDPNTLKSDTVQLQPGRDDLEQRAVVDADGSLICGEEKVALWLRRNPHGAGQVIENWKLALCPAYNDSFTVKKLYKALHARHGEVYDVEKFLTTKFRQARTGIRAFYKASPKSLKFPPQYRDQIRIEAMITVPCMWGHQSRCIMRNAAAAAGFENVQLLLEPLCAAALDILLLREAGSLKYGAVITWHDIGCATNDMATVRVNQPKTPGGPCQLEIVGEPTGDLLGAHRVQDMAWEYLQTSREVLGKGGLKKTLLSLGRMSGEELSRQVAAEIEIRKKIHPVVDFSITITAMADWQLVPKGVPHMSIRIEGRRMTDWLEKWAATLAQSQNDYLALPEQHSVSAVVTTGGGSKNATVKAFLEESARHMGVQLYNSPSLLPVAQGGLRQYPKRVTEPLAKDGYWYITRSAEFNESWHADVVDRWDHVQETRVNSPGDYDIIDEVRVVPLQVPALVTRSKITKGIWIVHDRLTPILSRKNGISTTHNVPMDFYIDADTQSRLTFNVYYSSTEHQDQEPLRDNRGLIHPEFTTIQMTFADIPSLEHAGFEEQQHDENHFFRLCGLTRMRCTDDNLELELSLFVPGVEPQYIDGEIDMTRLPAIFHSDVKEVWNIKRTHTIPDSEIRGHKNAVPAEAPRDTGPQKDDPKATATKPRARRGASAAKKKPAESKKKRKGIGKLVEIPARSKGKRTPASAKEIPCAATPTRSEESLSHSHDVSESSGGLRRSQRRQVPTEKLLARASTGEGVHQTPVSPLPRSQRTMAEEVLRALSGEL